jgi:hypothetical protein
MPCKLSLSNPHSRAAAVHPSLGRSIPPYNWWLICAVLFWACRSGQGIIALNQSANRDEDVFPDPDKFDIRWVPGGGGGVQGVR